MQFSPSNNFNSQGGGGPLHLTNAQNFFQGFQQQFMEHFSQH